MRKSSDASVRAVEKSMGVAETLHRILKLSNRLMAPFSTYLEHRYKISVNEFRLLMLIGRYGTAASHELVEMTGVNAMSVSRAVSALQKHGRIHVNRDPANRRRKTLSLTEEGERLYKVMRPQTDLVATYLLSELKPDEVDMLNRVLDTLIDTLEATDEEGRSLFLERTRPADDDEDAA
ncbi:DNA-binding MarR family transcriptional regulator [Sphingobium jiangsuense]|uniref:DNA-binding MarR family transcriptional regulator n=2 Tax=Sphingobium jiangsuense TaxID=870476 RepID=A0A7W6BRM2_9SPHN|nr:DNA-binding MarR family transcriptional regulator [Sphingobium jiangsuense]